MLIIMVAMDRDHVMVQAMVRSDLNRSVTTTITTTIIQVQVRTVMERVRWEH